MSWFDGGKKEPRARHSITHEAHESQSFRVLSREEGNGKSPSVCFLTVALGWFPLRGREGLFLLGI